MAPFAIDTEACAVKPCATATEEKSTTEAVRILDRIIEWRGKPGTIRVDNGKEFTDRLFGLRKRGPTGQHEFDQLCGDLGIEHRLAPPQHPQTNGMVERFNGRIEEVLQSHHFRSGEELETTLHRYVLLYNQQLPQSALGTKTPLQAMKDWHKLKPELFRKQPYHLPGCDTYDDKSRQEKVIKQSGLYWTIARPGVLLNGAQTWRYKVLREPSEWLNGIIARANVADFLVKQIEDRSFIGAAPVLVN